EKASPVIRQETRAVEQKFFKSFEAVRQSVYAAGMGGQAYPIDGAAWVAEATAAIDVLTALADTASSVAAELATRSASSGQWSFMLQLVLLSVCVTIGAVAFWVAVWRVGKPIQAMTAAMIELASGNLEVVVPGTTRKDEVGQM